MPVKTIEDDCFAPRRRVMLEYSGPDPLAWVRNGTSLIKKIFEVGTSSTGEFRWMWDWTGDPIQMYWHRWANLKNFGSRTKAFVSIRMVAFKYKSRNEGNFRMEFEPTLRHTIGSKEGGMGGWLFYLLDLFYWHIYYNSIRNMMRERCRMMVKRFMSNLRKIYAAGDINQNI